MANKAVENLEAIKQVCNVPGVKEVDLDWVAKLSDEERGAGRVGYVIYFDHDDRQLYEDLRKKISDYLATQNLEIDGSLYGIENRKAHKESIEEFQKQFPRPVDPQSDYYAWMRNSYYSRTKGPAFRALQKYQAEMVTWIAEYNKAKADGRIEPDKLPGFTFGLGRLGESGEIAAFYNSLNYKGD